MHTRYGLAVGASPRGVFSQSLSTQGTVVMREEISRAALRQAVMLGGVCTVLSDSTGTRRSQESLGVSGCRTH